MTDPTICDVFELLDKWRHLPDYQLERRADIYFALFLPDVLKARYGSCEIIPEFPLRYGTLWPEGSCTLSLDKKRKWQNRSGKVDYAAFTKDSQKVFFVELKTDLNSINDEQICRLKRAKGMEFKEFVDGIGCLSEKTEQGGKYEHLLKRLRELGVAGLGQKPEAVYILPECNPAKEKEKRLLEKVRSVTARIITFEEFAKEAEKHGPLGERFAQSLISWVEPAGSQKP